MSTMSEEEPEIHEENTRTKSVWCRGDKCRVRWSGDGVVYPALIRKILKSTGGRPRALVRFDGFGSEDDEEVNIEKLLVNRSKSREPKTQRKTTERGRDEENEDSIFSPQCDDENERLRKKFEMREREEELERSNSPPPRQSWKTTSKHLVEEPSPSTRQKAPPKKTPVVQRKRPVKKEVETPKASSKSASKKEPERVPPRAISPRFQFTDSESEDEKTATKGISHTGFDDADLEKPRFTHPGHSPKVALRLSGPGEEPAVCVPATINQYLWDYQRDGVHFLYKHHHQGTGAILGDDMGLGKTVQVIAFLSALLGKTGNKDDVMKQRPKFIRRMSGECSEEEEGPKKVYLIVGPASVLYNWVDELETWGYFTVGKYHKQHKEQTLADLRKDKLDIVVTTFETCRDNVDILNRFEWDGVIADEAHKIKGMKAEITQALKALKCKKRFGLTGTALQNDMKELWCILDWANPGCLGSVWDFEQTFANVILEGQKQDATKKQLAHARKAKEKFAELRNQWFIRRTKAIIADQLPKKEEQVVYCRPTSFQVDVYKAILGHPHIKVILTRNDPCPCQSGKTRGKCCYRKADDGRTVNQLLFSYLQMLVKTANHIALLMPEYTTNKNQRKQAEVICEVAFAQHPQFREQTRTAAFRTLSDPKYCGKMKVMAGLLKVFKKEKCKVLLFSLSTQLLDIIEHYVVTTGYEYRRLDGKTLDVKRVQLVREFNRDPGIFLFLSSTKAGGVGLNLTGANVVIIYDPNWNPTHDLQAQDRAYRVGQGRDVRVFRLITMGTIEENIYLRQVYKQQLDRVAVSEENAKRLFHREEIFGLENMFKFRDSESCLTTDILERNAKIETSLRGFHIQQYIPPPTDEAEGDGKPKATQKRRGKNQPNDLDFLRHEITSEDDEEDDEEYGEEDIENSENDEGSTTDDSITPTKIKPPKRRASRHLISDSDDDLVCGQKERVVNSRDSAGNGKRRQLDTPCAECEKPSPGTSKTKNFHTCTRTGKSEENRKGSRKNFNTTKLDLSEGSSNEGEGRVDGRRKSAAAVRQSSTASEPQATLACVSDVFDQYRVAHRHENQKLVGASRAEDHMTRCAIQDVYELHQYSQAPAAYCQPLTDSSEESDDLGTKPTTPQKEKVTMSAKKKKKSDQKKAANLNLPRAVVIGSTKVLIGQTPLAIRKQQFKEMAARFGDKDILDMAKRIMRWSPGRIQGHLRDFYTEKDPKLDEVFVDKEEEEEPTERETHTQKKKTSNAEGSRNTSRQRQQKKMSKSTKKGCEYSSSGEEEKETASRERKKSSTKRRKDRQVNSESDAEEDEMERRLRPPDKVMKDSMTTNTQSSLTEKLLDEMFDSGGEERRKSAPKTPRKTQKNFRHEKEKEADGAARKPPDTKGLSTKSVIDDLFGDSDEEDRRRKAPRTQNISQRTQIETKPIAEAKPNVVNRDQSEKLPDNAAAANRSVIDDLFDDDVVIRKAPPKRRSRPPPQKHSAKPESDDDFFAGVSPVKRTKPNIPVSRQDLSKRSTAISRKDLNNDSQEDLFSCVSQTNRDTQGDIGENSLETFSRECKVRVPMLNATVDDSLYDSDDGLFGDTKKWKKQSSKKPHRSWKFNS